MNLFNLGTYSLLNWQDRIIARLQQPYSLDCIPVEAEYQVGPINSIPHFSTHS